MPRQANATIIGVGASTSGPAGMDDWDRQTPAAPGADVGKWEGAARAYYRETTVTQTSDRRDVFVRRELIVDVADVDLMGLDTDDVITFELDDPPADSPNPQHGTASTIPRPRSSERSPDLVTSRIILADT